MRPFDEIGNHWQRTYDAADRLVKVLEPNANNIPSLETDYAYDTLGNLLKVDQWGGGANTGNDHVRQFAYDGLSRLVAANNPETSSAQVGASQSCANASGLWTTCYGYDSDSNLISKKDNRGIQISYSYDSMNRVLSKTYPDGTPPVGFAYDVSNVSGAANTNGALTQATVMAGNTMIAQSQPYAYSPVGKLLNEQQCTPANCSGTPYAMSYLYDWTGAVTQATNNVGTQGSPLTLSYSYDVAGRVTQATSDWPQNFSHPSTLFLATTMGRALPAYGPMGLQSATLGINTDNNTTTGTILRGYDNRGRWIYEADSGQAPISNTTSSASITVGGSGEQQITRVTTGGTATIVIGGGGGYVTRTDCSGGSWVLEGTVEVWVPNCVDVPAAGTINVTVNGYSAGATFQTSDTQATVAAALAASLNASGSPVTATVTGNVVTMTAKATGPASDYPFTITNDSTYGNYYAALGTAYAYTTTSALVGGSTAGTYYDEGTITATISGSPVSVNFGACSTPATVATALAAAINANLKGFVSATVSGSTIALTGTVGGVFTDWSVSAAVTWDMGDFIAPSYSVATTNLNGGSTTSTNMVYSFDIPNAGGYAPNGNLLAVNDSVIGQWNYGYDNLNRLTNATVSSGPLSGQPTTWSYDAFGNRMAETIQGVTTSVSFGSIRNQVTATGSLPNGFVYDAAGNVIFDGLNNYLYDAEGRVCAMQLAGVPNAPVTGYVYDAAGTRVAKGTLSQFSCNYATTTFTTTNSYVLGLGGEQVTEFTVNAGNSIWAHTNVFSGGALLATYSGDSTYFSLNDWLGTKRAEVGADGCVSVFSSMPFGGGLSASGNCPDATEHHFTGKERDMESGLDYFSARYYNSNMGRWMSPDWAAKPEAVPYSSLDDPQTLNLYGYVRNNPLGRADADGHQCCDDQIDFIGGVLKGATASVTFGIYGSPSASDSRASLAGQLLGTAVIGGVGTDTVAASGPTAVAGLIAAPETGGASLVVTVGAVGASAIGSEMAAGAAKNATAVVVAMGKGSYTNTHQSGMTYDGKGGPDRAAKSGAKVGKETGDKHVSTDHTPSSSDREGFKDESRRLDSHGGAGSNTNHNKIDSPGKKYRLQDGSN